VHDLSPIHQPRPPHRGDLDEAVDNVGISWPPVRQDEQVQAWGDSPELTAARESVRASAETIGGSRSDSTAEQDLEDDDERAHAQGSNTPAFASARFDDDADLDAVRAGTKVIKEGDQGLAVSKIQQALHDLRHLSRYQIDGGFGKKTKKGLRKFQNAADVDATGELDQSTLAAMQRRFDKRQVYVKAGKYDKDDPRTREIDPVEAKWAFDAMVPEEQGGAGSGVKFIETVNGEKYGDRIGERLGEIIPMLHQSYYADRVALRGDPDSLHDDATLEGPANAAKKVTDKVYGSYFVKKAEALSMGNGLVDWWDHRSAQLESMTLDELRSAARDFIEYLVRDWCDEINFQHGANPDNADEQAILDPILTAFVNIPAVAQKLNEIQMAWPGVQQGKIIGVQRFKQADQDMNRVQMWRLFHTCIHEYIHLLAHEDYKRAAYDLHSGGDSTRYHTLIEGFCDFFTLNVRAGLSIDAKLQKSIEGPYYDKKKPPPEIEPGVYPEHAQAEQVVSIVGIKNALAAYFRGEVDLIGIS
jgi:hypothetical protein